jgi:Mg-chelatase subunit ChlD
MEKKIFNLIIVDESGSMGYIRKQAFEGLNDTISTIRKMQKEQPDIEQRITLLTFDSDHKTFLYDNEPAEACRMLRWEQYEPGAATPLYDAIGMGVSKVNSQCGERDNVLVTIITDGYENSSEEFTLKMVHNLISKLKEQHWTFTLIGTDNLDVEGMAHSFAIDNHLSFKENPEETKAMFDHEHRARINYNACVREDVELPTGSYFEEEH